MTDLICALFGPYSAMFVNRIYPGKWLKTSFVSPGKPWKLVFASPGKSWKTVCYCLYEPWCNILSKFVSSLINPQCVNFQEKGIERNIPVFAKIMIGSKSIIIRFQRSRGFAAVCHILQWSVVAWTDSCCDLICRCFYMLKAKKHVLNLLLFSWIFRWFNFSLIGLLAIGLV